jgi:hypothetical protein
MSANGCRSKKSPASDYFQQELREFGLLDDEQENQKLAGYFQVSEVA